MTYLRHGDRRLILIRESWGTATPGAFLLDAGPGFEAVERRPVSGKAIGAAGEYGEEPSS